MRPVPNARREPRETVQIRLHERRGRRVIDVRVWSRSGSMYFPTSCGIELPFDLLPSLAKAAAEVLEDAVADGMVAEPAGA